MAPTLFHSQSNANIAICLKTDEQNENDNTNKALIITIELKVQAGLTFTSAHNYKKNIQVFGEGLPLESI